MVRSLRIVSLCGRKEALNNEEEQVVDKEISVHPPPFILYTDGKLNS